LTYLQRFESSQGVSLTDRCRKSVRPIRLPRPSPRSVREKDRPTTFSQNTALPVAKARSSHRFLFFPAFSPSPARVLAGPLRHFRNT